MIQKETVYMPLKNQEATFESRFIMAVRGIYRILNGEGVTEQLANKKEGYFFTEEQLNEYTANVIRQALETAAEKAEMKLLIDEENDIIEEANIDKQSITNTFEETYDKLKL